MDSKQAADRELFNTIAGDYAQKDIVKSTATVRKYKLFSALDFLLKTENSFGTILDIGCGVGAPSWFLEGTYDKYIGLDHSEKLIEYARSKKTSDKADFMVADLMNLDPQKVGVQADLILAVGVLHHVEKPDVLIESAKKVAGPGAYFVAIEPHRMNPFIQCLREIRKKIDHSYSSDQYYFKPSELVNLLNKNGLRAVSYKYHGFFSTPFGEVILRPQWIFAKLAKLTVMIDSVLDRILPGFLKVMSWSVIVRAEFPNNTSQKTSDERDKLDEAS